MVHIELSSRGRDTIALEMPDISYFSTNRSGGLEENCWEAENKLLTYRISDFRCRDFNVTRYQIYCKEDCCMRSLNVGNSFMGLSVVRQGIVECFLSETRDKRIWRKGYTNVIVSSGIKEERNLFRKGDTFGMTSILVSPDFFQHLSERYTEYFGSAYLRFGRGETFFIAPKNLSIPIALSVALNDLEVSQMMGNASPMYLEAKVTECLSLFMRETEGKEPVNAKIVGFSDRDKIYQARDIICSEYLNPPSLHDLALRVGTNECTLKAEFKEAFRTTVFNYLFDYRMNIAIHYLLDTNKSIGDVAGLVGYEHQAHFCTAFKRKFNVTPSEYRLKA